MSTTITDTPDYRNAEHTMMQPDWTLVADLRRGQTYMRSLGTKYLPKNPLETPTKYKNRVAMSRFYNVYLHTEDALMGLAYRRDPVLGDDVPKRIRGTRGERGSGIAENIDLQGTHLALFMRQVTKLAFDGHSFIHVEMPPKLKRGASRLDEKKAKRRPYWRPYRANQALNWNIEIVGGVPRLAQISFLENVQVKDGRFGKTFKAQYRVMLPGGWELWEESNDSGRITVTRKDAVAVDLPEIPVAVIYGHKVGALVSQPPLLDLAHENVYHFQLCSEFRNVTHIANTPVMVRIGARTDQHGKALPLGTDKIIDVDLKGDVKWLEHAARAIPHARNEIKDSEGRMAVTGMSLVGGRPEVEKTATQSILDNVEQTSTLGLIVRSAGDAGEQCLAWTAQFMEEGENGGSLNMNKSFMNLQLDPSKMSAISDLVSEGQLTVETMWAILKRAEELPDEFDPVEEAKKLAAQNVVKGSAPGEKAIEDKKPGQQGDDNDDNEDDDQ